MSALDDLLAALDGPVQTLIDEGHRPTFADAVAAPPPAAFVEGAREAFTERYPQQARRVRVTHERGEGRSRWRAVIRDDEGDELVGLYDDQPTAVMRGITALRFLRAGVPWRAEQ